MFVASLQSSVVATRIPRWTAAIIAARPPAPGRRHHQHWRRARGRAHGRPSPPRRSASGCHRSGQVTFIDHSLAWTTRKPNGQGAFKKPRGASCSRMAGGRCLPGPSMVAAELRSLPLALVSSLGLRPTLDSPGGAPLGPITARAAVRGGPRPAGDAAGGHSGGGQALTQLSPRRGHPPNWRTSARRQH